MYYGYDTLNEEYVIPGGMTPAKPNKITQQMPLPLPLAREQWDDTPQNKLWRRAFAAGSIAAGAGALWTGAAGLRALITKNTSPVLPLAAAATLGLGSGLMAREAWRRRSRKVTFLPQDSSNYAAFAATEDVTVRAHTRKGRLVRAHRRQVDHAEEQSATKPYIKAAAAAAIALGIPTATYLGIKAHYNRRTNKAAQDWLKRVADDTLPEVPGVRQVLNTKPIVFAADGIHNTRHRGYYSKEIYDAFDVNVVQLPLGRTELSDSDVITEKSAALFGAKTYIRDLMRNKPSDDSTLLVNAVLQQRKLNPDNPIILTGHSGGGLITNEAQDVLNRMGVKVQVVNTAGQYYGIETLNKLNNTTLVGTSDPMVYMSLLHNPMYVPGDHFPQLHKDTQLEWKRAMQVLTGMQPRTTAHQNLKQYRFVTEADSYTEFKVKKEG